MGGGVTETVGLVYKSAQVNSVIQDVTIQEAMMKLSVHKLMRLIVIMMVLLSAGTPMAITAKRESVATDVPTVEPESSVQHILIKVRPEVDTPTGRLAYAAPTPLARALTAQGVTTAQTLFRAASKTPSAIGLERIYRLELAADADVNKAVAALSANPNIEWAELDYIAHAVVIPDDPLYAEQWGLAKDQRVRCMGRYHRHTARRTGRRHCRN